MDNLKNIHIGNLIKIRVEETFLDSSRICNFFNCDDELIHNMYHSESLDSNIILKWSKLLEYDFFRLYSQHLVFYSSQKSMGYMQIAKIKHSTLPQFKKNIFTREMIEFILELVRTNKKTKSQIINEYRIPKTTLYKWLSKY
ncbi:transposase [Chryseobacterium sp. ERMR1:04]|uniref:transposase n=1 Tax=Chryseobacterium sp. ERMR1:04 TaxID=1705393 RepID=UPI0006C84D86|nr:transposase [Chryseobacterium sp. ERMR1:04]KPH14793.1 transposase [Chryseobacterium sp. ERMR1:04]